MPSLERISERPGAAFGKGFPASAMSLGILRGDGDMAGPEFTIIIDFPLVCGVVEQGGRMEASACKIEDRQHRLVDVPSFGGRKGFSDLAAWLKGEGCALAAVARAGDAWRELACALDRRGLDVKLVNVKKAGKAFKPSLGSSEAQWLATLGLCHLSLSLLGDPKLLRTLGELAADSRKYNALYESSVRSMLSFLRAHKVDTEAAVAEMFGKDGKSLFEERRRGASIQDLKGRLRAASDVIDGRSFSEREADVFWGVSPPGADDEVLRRSQEGDRFLAASLEAKHQIAKILVNRGQLVPLVSLTSVAGIGMDEAPIFMAELGSFFSDL